jgi:hypothetical protein
MTRLPHPPLLALALAVTLIAGVSGIMPSAQRLAKRAADPAGPVPIDLSKYAGQTVMVVAVSFSLFFSSGSMCPRPPPPSFVHRPDVKRAPPPVFVFFNH